MSLEEMIEEIETHVYSYMPCYGIDDDIGTRIIAALKAGQAMRNAAKQQAEAARMLGFGRQTIDPYLEAWDAALKGDDK